MKLLFLLFFFIYLNYVSTQDLADKRFVVKSYPKKVKPGMYQVNFSNKYINQKKLDEIEQQELEEEKKYTAFIPIDKKNVRDVPESLLFPNDLLLEQKTRVKKVLPDFWSSVRSKRSVDVKKTAEVKPVKPKAKNVRVGPKNLAKLAQRKGKKINRKGKKGAKRNAKLRSKVRSGNKTGSKNKKQKPKGKETQKKHRAKNQESHKKSMVAHNKQRDKKQESPNKGMIAQNQQKDKKQESSMKKTVNGTQDDARRLIAARDATIEEYPYVVSIQKGREHWCSGALLNPRLIITTANCMWKGSQISRMKVRVGSRYTDRGGQVFKIQEVMRHPDWSIRNNPDCDVALALLDGNVRFSHSVHSVDLPNQAMMPPFNDAWVASWGSERRDGVYDSFSNSLQVYHVRLMDHEKCNNITQRFRVSVTNNFICLTQTGRRAPCTRDTGAPAVSDGVLWGLASWGIRKLCGTERYPAMFSYLGSPANIEFITNATHMLMADERQYPYLDKWPRVRVTPTTPTLLTLPGY